MSTTIAPSGAPSITSWTIDASHSHLEFAVRHMMIATVKGRFSDVQGTVEFDGKDLSTARVEVEIPVASIDTRQEQRDAHLRSADFFDSARHPAMTFRSSRISGDPDGRFEIVGELTIRGIARSVTLVAESQGIVRDPWGMDRAGFTATTRIDRRDFGLDWNAALEAGGVVVSPEVKVTLDIELTKPGQ